MWYKNEDAQLEKRRNLPEFRMQKAFIGIATLRYVNRVDRFNLRHSGYGYAHKLGKILEVLGRHSIGNNGLEWTRNHTRASRSRGVQLQPRMKTRISFLFFFLFFRGGLI